MSVRAGTSVLRVSSVCVCRGVPVAAHVGVPTPLCPHPAASAIWGGCSGSWLCPPPQPCQSSQGDSPADPVGTAGTGPSGLQVQEAPAGHGSSSPSPIPPWDSDAPSAARGTAWDPQHCWTARPICCVPWGCCCRGTRCCCWATPPPHPSSPAGRWAVPGGNPGVIRQPAAAPAVASGLKFPGMATTTAFIPGCAFLAKVGSSQASP